MRTGGRRWFTATVAICLTLALPGAGLRADAAEYELKAAFIYNFARMVKWPEGSPQDGDQIRICVVEPGEGDGEATATIYRSIHGKEAQDTRVEVTVWDEGETCWIVFFVADSGATIGEWSENLAGQGVLTIGETDDFAGAGGVINFFTVDSKVRFQINPEAAERAGLVVNSQLIRLATIVHDDSERS